MMNPDAPQIRCWKVTFSQPAGNQLLLTDDTVFEYPFTHALNLIGRTVILTMSHVAAIEKTVIEWNGSGWASESTTIPPPNKMRAR